MCDLEAPKHLGYKEIKPYLVRRMFSSLQTIHIIGCINICLLAMVNKERNPLEYLDLR